MRMFALILIVSTVLAFVVVTNILFWPWALFIDVLFLLGMVITFSGE